MKIYQASLNLIVLLMFIKLFPDKTINVLRSFGLLTGDMYDMLVTYRDKIGSVIFDSGTWTLNNSKQDKSNGITLKKYELYVPKILSKIDFFLNYDSNFTKDGSETNNFNQLELESKGLKPVPVIHNIYGDEISYYLDRGYRRLALGSKQITSSGTLRTVMDKFKGTGCKIHLLGSTSFKYLANFPLDSCDSANWAHMGAYGYINYWNPEKNNMDKTDKIYMEEFISDANKGIKFSNYKYREEFVAFLQSTFDLTYADLVGPNAVNNKMLVNMYYYVQFEAIINEIHRKEGFI